MKPFGLRILAVLVMAGLAGGLVWAITKRLGGRPAAESSSRSGVVAIPVEVSRVEQGAIELRREFGGTLEPSQEFIVSARVGGRITRILVDLADSVENGQVVAELDSEEFRQAVAQADANLAVTRAGLVQAESARTVSERTNARIRELNERGLASQAERDTAEAELLARRAGVEVARAEITRAEAALEAARIRLRYTTVAVAWDGEDERRVVAQRSVDVGDTVAANASLLSVVDLDPLTAVVYVTERDYALLRPGQRATITTDAFPSESFPCVVRRIAPVFRSSSRQARIELEVPNSDHSLRPGMYLRVTVVLGRAENASIVSREALTSVDGRTGVFVVSDAGTTVTFREVRVGIENADRVQIIADGVEGVRVVTLGQKLLAEGSAILIADPTFPPPAGNPEPRAATP